MRFGCRLRFRARSRDRIHYFFNNKMSLYYEIDSYIFFARSCYRIHYFFSNEMSLFFSPKEIEKVNALLFLFEFQCSKLYWRKKNVIENTFLRLKENKKKKNRSCVRFSPYENRLFKKYFLRKKMKKNY